MKKLKYTLLLLCLLVYTSGFAQDDLLSLLGEEEETTEYAKASFKTTRVINGHSLENVAGGVMDLKISHRFGMLNTGAYNLFGLDQASIRIGLDYGINDRLMIGGGRSSHNKVYDGFVKYKLLRQSSGKKTMPISLAILSGVYLKTIEWQQPERENYFSSRLEYTHQLILGRKFSEGTTLQFMPTVVHRNLVPTAEDAHDVILIGVAARQKLTKRVAINVEYYYALPEQLPADRKNSLAIGFDIETGGHVFQLHFTNSTSMIEPGFMTETIGDWGKGDIHFGFNVSRVFTIRKPKTE
ncbi:hypothetical protein H8S95_02095 [Pontibacter sp. KCTC 32443]|uniref:DUF5777 family beta-barrel protein n=1 Tax=Pontibacter TaxID=323449 RepID=UPI00164E195C|nr:MULTISPECIES: DUF5777 family beta-barrel protein [Pontibacter]MBC5772840.1 hypothetical protein [Pontibacter sp. KCTC 32443]